MNRSTQQPRTASKATRMFFELLEESEISHAEIAEKTGNHVNTFYGWKTGKTSATLINMEAALAVLGLEFVIRPISQTNLPD